MNLASVPIVGEMLVDEHRHHPAAGAKDLEGLLPEPAFRILRVADGGLGILAVLGDQQHSIHRQAAGAQRQRILNRLTHPEPVRGGEQPADVLLRLLIRVKRGQFERRILAFAVQRVGLKQPADDHVRVRIVVIDGDDGGDFFGGQGRGCGRRRAGGGKRHRKRHERPAEGSASCDERSLHSSCPGGTTMKQD